MGLMSHLSSSGYTPSEPPKSPLPDPLRFKILELIRIGRATVAVVQYPNCNTYEGLKVLVYDYAPIIVRRQTFLDPHFSDQKDHLYPVARFEPTARGRRLARIVAEALNV